MARRLRAICGIPACSAGRGCHTGHRFSICVKKILGVSADVDAIPLHFAQNIEAATVDTALSVGGRCVAFFWRPFAYLPENLVLFG